MMQDFAQAVLRVCFDREASDQDLSLLGDHERWRLYRRMVRGRLETLLHTALPRSLEALGPAETTELIRAWFASERPQSRYFWRIPLEFGAFVTPRLPTEPAHLADLVRFELSGWRVRQSETSPAPTLREFSFEARPALEPSAVVLCFDHPVHRAGEESTPEPTQLCLYRTASHSLGVLALNPIAAALLEALIARDAPLADTVRSVTEARGVGIDANFLEKLSALIETLFEREILLGSR